MKLKIHLVMVVFLMMFTLSSFGKGVSLTGLETTTIHQNNLTAYENPVLLNESPETTNPVVDEGLLYFRHLDELSTFFVDNPEVVLDGYESYDHTVQVYGYNPNYSTYIYGSLSYSVNSDGSLKFQVNFISANSVFGNPQLDFVEVQTVAEANESVAEFISLYPEIDIQIQLVYSYENSNSNYQFVGYRYYIYYGYYGYNVAESIDDGQEVSDSLYYYHYQWLSLVLDDESGSILEIHGTTIHKLSLEEVTEIALNFSGFEPILETEYEIDIYFDGYSYWSVYIYNSEGGYAYSWINDETSEVEYYYVFIPIPATRMETEVKDSVRSLSEVQNWMEAVSKYEIYVYYDLQGTWWIYLYDPIIYSNWVYVQLDDESGDIIDIQIHLTEPPKMSDRDVFALLKQMGLNEFYQKYPDSRVYYSYDGYGTWYIYVYSLTIIEAYRAYQIDDASAEITVVYESNPSILPTKTASQIEQMVIVTEEYQNFTNQHEITGSWIYYYNGIWYAQYEGRNSNGDFKLLMATIDDKTGDLIEISVNSYYWIWLEDDVAVGAANDMSKYGPNSNRDEGIPLGEILEQENTSNDDVSLDLIGSSILLGLCTIVGVYRTRKSIR